MSERTVLRFADLEWRAAEQRLLRAGQPVELGARAFDLLGLLASRAGEVLGKEEAFARVWPGRVVEENNLQVQVATLRRLLGREAIATVPGRGYRLTLPVQADGQPAPQPTGAGPAAATPGAAGPALLGRGDDLAALHQALALHPVVTVVGEGGLGKTALARALLAELPAHLPGHWVDLADMVDEAQLPHALARAVGLTLATKAEPLAALCADWPAGPRCLVLDNCEHLATPVASLLAQLLARQPALKVLATSQVRLNLAQEQVHRLGPLGLPQGQDWAAVLAAPAVQLLLARVQASQPGYRPDPSQGPALASLCQQLDGLALAIELAAAQVARLGLPAVCQRLGDRLRLLTGGPLDRPERQRTLAATLAWSHGLLEEPERVLYRRLAVFAGGFDLPGALAVAVDAALDDWTATEALATLVDRCLVGFAPGHGQDGGPRYRLLETTRAHAQQLCQAAGEQPAVAGRHARWMHQRFEQAYEELGTRSDTGWRDSLGPELDNLRAALDHSLREPVDPDTVDLGIGLAGWSADLWPILSLLDEGRRRLELARSRLRPDTPDRAAAALWDGIGYLWQDADPRRALQARLSAERHWRAADDRRWVRSVLGQAWNRLYTDELPAAEQALADTQDAVAGHGHLRALHRTTLGALRQRQGRDAEALQAYEEALQLRRAQGDARRTLIMLLNLGDLACSSGQPAQAVNWGRQAESEARRQGDEALLAVILGNLATAHLFLGDVHAADACARQAAPRLQRSDGLAYFVDTLAWLAGQQGRLTEAAHLMGAADAALAARGVVRQPAEERVRQALQGLLASGAEAQRVAAWQAQGRHWSEAQVLAAALP